MYRKVFFHIVYRRASLLTVGCRMFFGACENPNERTWTSTLAILKLMIRRACEAEFDCGYGACDAICMLVAVIRLRGREEHRSNETSIGTSIEQTTEYSMLKRTTAKAFYENLHIVLLRFELFTTLNVMAHRERKKCAKGNN